MRTVIVMLSLLGSFALPLSAADSMSAVPKELRGRVENALPAWVAVDRALDANGELLASKVGEYNIAKLRRWKALQDRGAGAEPMEALRAGSCAGFRTLPTPEHYRRNGTIRDLTSEATDVIVGRLVGREEGFFRGSPASLLRIAVTATPRASDELYGRSQDVYLVYPYASLNIAGAFHCTRVPGLAYEPAAGDRVIVFKYLPSASPDAVAIEADARREVIFEQANTVVIPPLLASDPSLRTATSFDALVSVISNAVEAHDRAVKVR